MLNPCSLCGITAALALLSLCLHPANSQLVVPIVNISGPLDLYKTSKVSARAVNLALRNFTIHRFAALGDSYASGIGSGERVEWWCSRYDASYGSLVWDAIRPQPVNKRREEREHLFQYKACFGADTHLLLEKQLPKIKKSVDAMTLTIGGNDMGFSNILNDCVFGWWAKPLSKCDDTINQAFTNIEQLGPKLDAVLAKSIEKLTPGTGRLYVTGYAKMFNDETTQCDNSTWALHGKKNAKYLTRERRRQFNKIADALNDAIEAAVERAGNQVVFVNLNPYSEMCEGRFCELGVAEPDFSRRDQLFFGFKGPSVDLTPSSRNSTSIQMEGRCFTSNFISDKLLRTSHPRPNAHRIFADLVLWHMEVEKAKYLGLEAPLKPGNEICATKDSLEIPEDDFTVDEAEITKLTDTSGGNAGSMLGGYGEKVERMRELFGDALGDMEMEASPCG